MSDEAKAVYVNYLHFQKVFDKVPLKRLLKKLESNGIAGKILKSLEDWLSERKQRIVINSKYSNGRDVISSVPQGSVLGPIIFLYYVNVINEGLNCKISKLTDYTNHG